MKRYRDNHEQDQLAVEKIYPRSWFVNIAKISETTFEMFNSLADAKIFCRRHQLPDSTVMYEVRNSSISTHTYGEWK